VFSATVSFAHRLLRHVTLDLWEAIPSGCKVRSFCFLRILVFFVVRVRSWVLPCCSGNVTMAAALVIILKHWYVFVVLHVSLGALSLSVPPGTLHCLHGIFWLFVCVFYLVLFWQIYYYMDYELNFMHALYLHLLLQPTVLCSGLVVVAVDVYLLRARRDSYAVVLTIANGVDDGRCRR